MLKFWSKQLDFKISVGTCAPPNYYIAPPPVIARRKQLENLVAHCRSYHTWKAKLITRTFIPLPPPPFPLMIDVKTAMMMPVR